MNKYKKHATSERDIVARNVSQQAVSCDMNLRCSFASKRDMESAHCIAIEIARIKPVCIAHFFSRVYKYTYMCVFDICICLIETNNE